jgi:hypothetical protein
MVDIATGLTSVALVGVGALGTYVTGSLQFRRQAKLDHERWVRDRQLDVYTDAFRTFRTSDEIDADLAGADDGAPLHVGYVRKDAPESAHAVLSRLLLVGNDEVRTAVQEVNKWTYNAEVNGEFFHSDWQSFSLILWRLEAAMIGDLRS